MYVSFSIHALLFFVNDGKFKIFIPERNRDQ